MGDRPSTKKGLGLQYGRSPNGKFLGVASIGNGIVKDHNDAAPDRSQMIRAGDYIVRFRGEEMQVPGMMAALSSVTGKFQLMLIRPWEDGVLNFPFVCDGDG